MLDSKADVGHQNGWAVKYWSNVKLGGFQSQLETSNMCSHTEELWYKETVCL